jgi:hypothetical protein
MPNINQIRESKFLRKEDVGEGMLLTIKDIVKQNVALAGEPKEEKWVMVFEEAKPLVLNSTNTKRAAKVCGSEETDDWIGKQIVAYNDEEIEFAGDIVGGIRLRAPRGRASAPKPSEDSEPVPF